MPRPGGGGGSHHSSGSHSFSHSSSSHRVGSSHSSGRPMGGSRPSSGFRSSGSSGGYHGPRYSGGFGGPRPPRRFYGGRRTTVVYSNGDEIPRTGGLAAAFFIIWIALFIIFIAVSTSTSRGESSSASNAKSTIQRERLETNYGYISDCVEDELGWLDNVSRTETKLKNFYDKTGVQPYVILKAYDSSLTTTKEKENWATNYYDTHFDRENIFLVIYFAERDSDNDMGIVTYTPGNQAVAVMDSEAKEIFSNYLDRYWFDDSLSMDDVLVNTFNKTASVIMRVSTTAKDVVKWILIVILVALSIFGIIRVLKLKAQREKEKAEEDARILNTPIDDVANNMADNLEKKYLNEEDTQ